MELSDILDTVRAWPPWITYAILFGGSLVEYVLPPFPGDTVVLAGAVLVGAFGWSVWPVAAVVTAGAVLGASLDFWLGRWMVRSGRLDRLGARSRAAVDDLIARFKRHGAVYLVLNRFLPGIRAFFFVAAGLAGLRLPPVLLWSTVSAVAWNALIITGGYALGDNLEELETLVDRYQTVMWGVIALVVLVVAYKLWRKLRGSAPDGDAADSAERGGAGRPGSIVELQLTELPGEGDGAEEVHQHPGSDR